MTVAIPLLDDRDGIRPCLDSILAQRGERAHIVEILVMDGGSVDGSREAVAAAADRDARVQLLDNPDRHVPSAMNTAIARMTTDILVRVDSHTVLAEDYCDVAVALLDETGADVVGGHMRPEGTTESGRAVAWALCSRWGIGGSSFHDVTAEGPAQTVYMGVFRRRCFERFGGFDERFTRNQDDELAYRISEGGGTLWLSARLRSTYEPRSSLRRLARQFQGYGRYKPMVLALHPSGLRIRHLAPPAAAAAWIALPLALRWPVVAVPAAAHVAAVTVAARGDAGTSSRWRHRVAALLTMHLAYGWGFWRGLPDGLRAGGGARQRGASAGAGAPPARR